MKTAKIYQELKAHGWQFQRSGKGSHEIWTHPDGRSIVVSLKSKTRDVPYCTQRKILGKIRRVA